MPTAASTQGRWSVQGEAATAARGFDAGGICAPKRTTRHRRHWLVVRTAAGGCLRGAAPPTVLPDRPVGPMGRPPQNPPPQAKHVTSESNVDP